MRTNQRWLSLCIAVGLAAVAAACGPRLQDDTAHPLTGPPGEFTCGPPPGESYKDIGHAGDFVDLVTPVTGGSRRHVLTVREGAVPSNQTFRFTVRDAGYQFLAVEATSIPRRRFDPQRVTLTLSYVGCTPANPTTVQMYRFIIKDGGRVWEPVPNQTHDPQSRTVTAPRDSLSEYALGAG